jgi:GTP-binding protein
MTNKIVIQLGFQTALNQQSSLKLLRQATFLQSAAKFDQCPPDLGREVAFVGRSNAGKSSVLNRVTDNGRLARTSKTPGRTQLLNFFNVNEFCRLVDLPGYGFARVQAKVQKAWEEEMINYLNGRKSLAGLVLVMDARHPLQEMDMHFLSWAIDAKVPVQALLNKADKFSNNQARNTQFKVEADLRVLDPDNLIKIQLFSAPKSTGSEELRDRIVSWLELEILDES